MVVASALAHRDYRVGGYTEGFILRRAARKDETQADIVEALRKVGARVMVLDAFDLLVHHQGDLYMLEAKTPRSKKGRVVKQASQQKLEADGWPLRYVRSPKEALAVLGITLLELPAPVGSWERET